MMIFFCLNAGYEHSLCVKEERVTAIVGNIPLTLLTIFPSLATLTDPLSSSASKGDLCLSSIGQPNL